MTKKTLILSAFVFVLGFIPGMSLADPASPTPSQAVQDWALDRMESWSPPGKALYPDAKESESDGKARYATIVRDAMSVAYDPVEPPLFNNDPIGRAKTLAVMLAIADSESGGFRRDVDFNIGKLARGDGGKSWCIMQIQLSRPDQKGQTNVRIGLKGDQYEYVYAKDKGFGGEDLIANRKTCFRVALHMARESFRACGNLPVEERLSIYAGGDCTSGRAASRVRVGKAIRWLAAKAPPNVDQDLSGSFSSVQLASSQ